MGISTKSVFAFILDENNSRILLVDNKPDQREDGRIFKPAAYGLPGGQMEVKDEDEIECIFREIGEETGSSQRDFLEIDLKNRNLFYWDILPDKEICGGKEKHLVIVFFMRLLVPSSKIVLKVPPPDSDVYGAEWVPIDCLSQKNIYKSHQRRIGYFLSQLKIHWS